MRNPFKYFKTSPEIIRLAVMMYIRFPLSLRNGNGRRHERGIDRGGSANLGRFYKWLFGLSSA
jgi:hypothetical protein